LFIPEPPKFDQLACTFGALQNMQVLWIRKIQLFRGIHPSFQCVVVDAADSVRVRMSFENVLLKLLKEQRVVIIILRKRQMLVHRILLDPRSV